MTSEELIDLSFEPVILVTRGDDMPKKNYEKKKHPTYETSIRIKTTTSTNKSTACKPHAVSKFFHQYRQLHSELLTLGIGKDQPIPIDVEFPPTHQSSSFGLEMNEIQLQERCFMLNKWMQVILAQFPSFPDAAQKLISEFLSLDDGDLETEVNKELVLNLIKRGWKRSKTAATNTDPISLNKSPASLQRNNSWVSGTKHLSSNTSMSSYSMSDVGTTDSFNKRESDLDFDAKPSSSSHRQQVEGQSISSSRTSQGTTSSKQTTSRTRLLENYIPRPITVHGILAVSVKPTTTKQDDDYKTSLQILPLEELLIPNKSDLVGTSSSSSSNLARFLDLPPIHVRGAFDRYFSLKEELKRDGIFSQDSREEAYTYNVQMAQFYGDRQDLAIVLNCPFPRIHRRTSWGMALSKRQLQDRWVLLHTWVGHLLKEFYRFKPSAQEKVAIFLGLNCKDIHRVETESESLKSINLTDRSHYTKIYLLMLRNSFFSSLEIHKPMSTGITKDCKNSKNTDGLCETNETQVPACILSEGFNEAVVNYTSADHHDRQHEESANARLLSSDLLMNNSASAMSVAVLMELNKESLLYSFLGLQVTLVDNHPKKNEEPINATEEFETTLRILPYAEVLYQEKRKIDRDAYMNFQKSSSRSISAMIKEFSSYWKLKDILEQNGVFGTQSDLEHFHEKISKKLNKAALALLATQQQQQQQSVLVLDAIFPKRYRRRVSLGLSLSEKKLQTRAALLNHWMGKLMSHFHVLSPTVQDILLKFLRLQPITINHDSPLHEVPKNHDAFIIAMLHRKFVPPMKKIILPSLPAAHAIKKKKKRFSLKLLSDKADQGDTSEHSRDPDFADVDNQSTMGSESANSSPIKEKNNKLQQKQSQDSIMSPYQEILKGGSKNEMQLKKDPQKKNKQNNTCVVT